MRTALVHLGAGIGNIVLATPLISALEQMDFGIDLCLSADYPETAGLFDGWPVIQRVLPGRDLRGALSDRHDVVIAAMPPFYWSRVSRLLHGCQRPPDSLFYADEQGWYLEFAVRLGWHQPRRPETWLPIPPSTEHSAASSVVLAPGCKTGEMARKRWPHFVELAERLSDFDLVLVGTPDDLVTAGESRRFPRHVHDLVGKLTLRETAAVIAGAGVAVANDSGLAHVAAAVGTPTITLFGPTSEDVLGPFPRHQTALRAPLPCAPCWQRARFAACDGRMDCLRSLSADVVERSVRVLIGPRPG